MPFVGTLRDTAGQEYIVLQQTNLDLEQASATVISDLRCAMQQVSQVYTRKSPAIVQAHLLPRAPSLRTLLSQAPDSHRLHARGAMLASALQVLLTSRALTAQPPLRTSQAPQEQAASDYTRYGTVRLRPAPRGRTSREPSQGPRSESPEERQPRVSPSQMRLETPAAAAAHLPRGKAAHFLAGTPAKPGRRRPR